MHTVSVIFYLLLASTLRLWKLLDGYMKGGKG